MKRKIFTALIIIMISFTLLPNEDRETECVEHIYSHCQESLDYYYTAEEEQIENELGCEDLASGYCSGRYTTAEYHYLLAALVE